MVAKRALKTGGLGDITAGYTTLYAFINSLSEGTMIHANGWNLPSNLTDLPAKPSSKSIGVALDIIKGGNTSLYYDTVVLRYTESTTGDYHEYHGHMNDYGDSLVWSELQFVSV